MIADLKPYSAYKDSGVPWLGEVPERWEVKRGKAIFRCIDIRSSTGDEELLTVSSERGVVPRSSTTVTMFKAESYVGYKLCWPGDLVINSLWAWARGLGMSEYYGIVSSAYGVYRLRPQYKDYSAYIHELIRSVPFNWELRVRSKGIWISRLELTDEAFLGAPFPLPPANEQVAIVRFLDYVDRRLRRYIRAKQKLIKLLEEQKQAIIHCAVTRGLNPNVRLKPSGIDWLGEVPAHWTLQRFKFLAKINSGQVDPRSDPYCDWLLIAPNHIESGTGKVLFEQTAREQGADSGKYAVMKDQIIYSKIRPNLRKATIAFSDCLCSADMYAISPKASELRPEFLLLLLLSEPITRYAVDCSMRVAMPKVNREALADCWLWYPSVTEQYQILERLSVELDPINAAIRRARREIDLIREYRTRLIADVVTGKLDVRGVELPGVDEAEVPADWDDGEDAEVEETINIEEAVDADE
jgi:type I restriction enzyme, S subunit